MLEQVRQVLIIVAGATGLVLSVIGLIIGRPWWAIVGVIFVVAFLMGENLSHFSLSRSRVSMRSRAPARGSTRVGQRPRPRR